MKDYTKDRSVPLPLAGLLNDAQISMTDCHVENTYQIKLRDGKLVHDEWTRALFRDGYQVLPTGTKD